MDFALLGPLAVRVNGTELPLDGGRQWAVLAVLLMRPNTIVTTDTLVEELWGAKPTPTSTNAVHGYVSRLRKTLGRDVIETRPPGYVLRVRPGALDAQRFEDRLEQGSRLLAEGAAEEARRVLGEALALWRGPALADFRYESFAQAEAARLEELKLVALGERIEADTALGRHARLIGELEALVAAHPHQERLRGQLMLALYRSGRQADALEAYRDARAALDELGLEPGAKLKQLEREILAQDPSLELPVAPVAEAGVVGALSPSRAEPGRWAQRKLVTVLVIGVRGTTGAVESLDPEVLSALHAGCLERMRVVAERHGGAVGEFAGEVAMAVFGLPAVHEDDAVRALRAAVEMREAMVEFGIESRIGVDSGVVVAGGGGQAVTGSAVTGAVRLERAAQPGEVLVGEQTLRLAREAATAEQLDLQDGRGPVQAWRLASVSAQVQSRRSDSPFVGREQELRALSQAWERVRAELRCELVTVVGEAGVGKSRLVAELLPRVEATVARGRCLSYGAGITYWPVVEVLTQLLPQLGELDPTVAAPLRGLLDDTASASTAELAWAFRKLVEAVAHERPLLLVFDDIQWAEEGLLELIEHLALVSSGAPILLLCMARLELLEKRPGWSGLLPLEPLDPEDAERLVRSRLGDGDSPESRRIAAVAGGNPLFVEELATMLRESGGDQPKLPPTIQVVLAARLDQLEADERTVLEAAAIEGEVFHLGGLQALTPEEPALTSLLTALVRRQFVRPDQPALEGEDAFRFRHLLLREAAYNAIPKTVRATLHEQYADWLQQHGEAMDAFVGYHLEHSYRYRTELAPLDDESRALGERAAGHLAASARRAGERGDHRAAANLLERALAVGLAEPHKRAENQLHLRNLFWLAGRPAEHDALLAEVVDTATRLGNPALITRVRLVEAAAMTSDPESDLEQPRRIVEEAIETLSELGDQQGLASADGLYGAICVREGRMADALAHRERALAAAEANGWREMRRATITVIARVLALGPAPVGEAIRRCEELILIDPSDRVVEARVGGHISALVAMADRTEEALELAERFGRCLDERTVIISLVNQDPLAEAKEYAGARAAAIEEREAHCEKLEEIFTGRPPAWAISASYKLALLYCDEGRWEDAERRLAHGPELSVSDCFREEAVLRLAGRARVAAHHGQHDEAVGLATKAVELAEQTDMLNLRGRVWEAHAEVQRAAGNGAENDVAIARALELYEQKGNVAALRAAAHASLVPSERDAQEPVRT